MVPISEVYLSQLRYQEMLAEAENERRYRQLQGSQASLQRRFLLRIGDFLITFGQKLKTRYQPETTSLAYRAK